MDEGWERRETKCVDVAARLQGCVQGCELTIPRSLTFNAATQLLRQ